MNKIKPLLLLGTTILVLSACGETETKANDERQSPEDLIEEIKDTATYIEEIEDEPETDEQTNKRYNLGEEAIVYNIDTDENIFGFKITKVTNDLTVDSDVYTDGRAENTIEITYEYTNYNLDEPYIVSSQFVNAYDSNGKAGKNMGFQDGQTEVTAGRTAESTIWIVMENPIESGDIIEIDYGNDFVYGFNDYITYSIDIE